MNNELNDGTTADSSIKADIKSVSQTIAKPHVVGSASRQTIKFWEDL